jgi:hypothetical protein
VEGTAAGRLSVDDDDIATTEDVNNVALRTEGIFYRAGDDTDAQLTNTDSVGESTKGVTVYSYVDPEDDSKNYVVKTSTDAIEGGDTTYTYTAVDIMAPAAAPAEGENDPTQVKVQAAIPTATDYKHIHFGVWAALGDAKADGTQVPSELGIGFVQSIGDGPSGDDMPNNGEGTFEGNWVAAVQAKDEDGDGAIDLDSGDATLTADFGKETIIAELTGLATLTGVISGNTFSGDKDASGISHTSLDLSEDFEGSFSGWFYGSKAAEAGGIFDYASEDNEGGAFRGAFGADRKD